jgi:guanylate kinase
MKHWVFRASLFTMASFCRSVRGFSLQSASLSRALMGTRKPFQNNMQMVLADMISTSSKSNSDDDDSVLDPLIVCGPSGVGKGTIISKFMDELGGQDKFGFTVSHTTRQPREGEIKGIHYHFVEKEYMKQEIDRGAFLEYAAVHGNLYGTSLQALSDVQKGGKRCLLDIDVAGVRSIKSVESEMLLKPKYVFIAPPSFEALKERLLGRGTETPESMERRTANAKAEVEYGTLQNFDAIVVNNDLDMACHEFLETVKTLYGL